MEKTIQPIIAMIHTILNNIVQNPNAIVIEDGVDSLGRFITIKVDPIDVGKVIGKQGKTVDAIRTLVRSSNNVELGSIFIKVMQPDRQ